MGAIIFKAGLERAPETAPGPTAAAAVAHCSAGGLPPGPATAGPHPHDTGGTRKARHTETQSVIGASSTYGIAQGLSHDHFSQHVVITCHSEGALQEIVVTAVRNVSETHTRHKKVLEIVVWNLCTVGH